MTRYFLGVDIGGTKSHALVVDERGQAVGFGVGGPGNHESVGYDGFAETLRAVTEKACVSAGISASQLDGAGFGVAGYDWPSDREPMLRAIDSLGLDAPYDVVNDAVISLIAGAKQGWGVTVIAGTGCNARGRDQQHRTGRVTGEGWQFGEYAGGSELIARTVQAISRAWSMRGPETALTGAFVEHVGAQDVDDLFEGLCRGRYHLSAGYAPLVFAAAQAGDQVANDLILWAGRELGNLAIGVIRQLGLEALRFEVVLAGSFYKGSPLLADMMRETIHAIAPGAELVHLAAPPVVGGAILGMECAGLDVAPLRDRMIESTNIMVHKREST